MVDGLACVCWRRLDVRFNVHVASYHNNANAPSGCARAWASNDSYGSTHRTFWVSPQRRWKAAEKLPVPEYVVRW